MGALLEDRKQNKDIHQLLGVSCIMNKDRKPDFNDMVMYNTEEMLQC